MCRSLGLVFKPREIGSNPISGCHLSGDRAGHSCRPGKAITQDIDQLAIPSGGIHSTAVTTCCPVVPSTWTPSLSRETSALWSNAHSSHSMAIETPLDPVEGEILKTDSNRPSVPPGHPMVDQHGQFRRGVPIGTIYVEYYLYTGQYSGLGNAHLQELTASGIWSQDQSQLHINVLELQAIWLGLKAFSQRVENAKVALMSDNTSAVAYLRNQGGGGAQIASNEQFSHRHMSVGREEGNDTSFPSPSRTSECVSGPFVTEGSNPQDRMEPKPDHSRQAISCMGQTIRGSVRPEDKHKIGKRCHGKWTVLSRTGTACTPMRTLRQA